MNAQSIRKQKNLLKEKSKDFLVNMIIEKDILIDEQSRQLDDIVDISNSIVENNINKNNNKNNNKNDNDNNNSNNRYYDIAILFFIIFILLILYFLTTR
jgi:ATP-dependent Zn protease